MTHGYQGLRQDALRVLPTFAGLGLTSLTITYRNAHGAPCTPQGVYKLSAEKWEDQKPPRCICRQLKNGRAAWTQTPNRGKKAAD